MSDLYTFTEVFPLNSPAQKAASQLMKTLGLPETGRVIIGNNHKELYVCLTWQGVTHKMHLFKHNYITTPHPKFPNDKVYHHLYCLAGADFESVAEFKKFIVDHEKNNGEFKIEKIDLSEKKR